MGIVQMNPLLSLDNMVSGMENLNTSRVLDLGYEDAVEIGIAGDSEISLTRDLLRASAIQTIQQGNVVDISM